VGEWKSERGKPDRGLSCLKSESAAGGGLPLLAGSWLGKKQSRPGRNRPRPLLMIISPGNSLVQDLLAQDATFPTSRNARGKEPMGCGSDNHLSQGPGGFPPLWSLA